MGGQSLQETIDELERNLNNELTGSTIENESRRKRDVGQNKVGIDDSGITFAVHSEDDTKYDAASQESFLYGFDSSKTFEDLHRIRRGLSGSSGSGGSASSGGSAGSNGCGSSGGSGGSEILRSSGGSGGSNDCGSSGGGSGSGGSGGSEGLGSSVGPDVEGSGESADFGSSTLPGRSSAIKEDFF